MESTGYTRVVLQQPLKSFETTTGSKGTPNYRHDEIKKISCIIFND